MRSDTIEPSVQRPEDAIETIGVDDRSRRPERVATMAFIMAAVLIDTLSFNLIIPVLPALVGNFVSSKSEQSFWYGALIFAFCIVNFFGSPMLGALSDRYGRRPVLLLGFCGLALNFFATALASALWLLIVVRLAGGAMQANASVANAYVADITAPEERARRFGMLGAMFGLGMIAGPMMGGLLGAIDVRLPFFVAGGLALLNLLYGYFVLPESLPADRRRAFSWRAVNPINSLRELTQLKGVGPLVMVFACSQLAQNVVLMFWVLFTAFKFGWGPEENGWALATVGAMSVIGQGFLLGRLLKRFGPPRLVVLGLLSSTFAYALWAAAINGWMIFAIIVLNILGYTVAASVQSIVSGAAESSSQGQTLGAVNSINSLMAVIAPVIGAPLFGMVSSLPQGDWRIGAPLYLCAGLQAVALGLAVFHLRHTPPAWR